MRARGAKFGFTRMPCDSGMARQPPGRRQRPRSSTADSIRSGRTGLLNCLDPVTGKMFWQRNIVADTGAPLPMWGFASSPLVVDGVVIVFAGGPDAKGLVAYRAESGDPQWTTATGPISYGSPQPVQVGGETQILFLSDWGLVAVRPATGEVCWRHEAINNSIWRTTQPRLLGDASVLFGSEDFGLVRLDLSTSNASWTAAERWASKAMKPAYNDFVVSDGAVYGFDGSIFCCVDAETGERRWKAGRYGHGQLLLLDDQKLLVVLSEAGDVILVAAQTGQHQEIGASTRWTAKLGITHRSRRGGCMCAMTKRWRATSCGFLRLSDPWRQPGRLSPGRTAWALER